MNEIVNLVARLAISAAVALTFFIPDSVAQSGTVSSNSPCQLAAGQNTCNVTLTWQKSNTPIACLWLQSTGGLFACSGNDSDSAVWPWTNAIPDTFILRAHQNWNNLSISDPAIASITVQALTPPPPLGYATSNSPCQLAPGQATCNVTISWSKSNTPIACLWLLSSGTTISCSGNDSDSAIWTWTNVIPDTLVLRAHPDWSSISASGQELTRITVQATPPPTPTGTISASPNPVQVSGDAGTTTLTWSASNVSQTHVTVSVNGGTEGDFATAGPSGAQAAPWIGLGNQYVFKLRAETFTGTVLSSVTVTGTPPPAPVCSVSASPQSIVVGQQSTLSASCSGTPTSYNWSNANGGPIASGTSGTYVFSSTGSFAYAVQACNSGGCGSYSSYVTVVVSPPPPYQSTFISQSVPSQMFSGRQYSVNITMRNDGGDTWSAGAGYYLGSENPTGNSTWGLTRVPLPGSVSTGQQVTFSFNVTAPLAASTPNFQWRMLRDGVSSFGAVTSNAPVIVQTPPARYAGGSNLNFYNYPRNADGSVVVNCETQDCYFNYGIPFSYAKTGVRQTVQATLANMYAAGQRSVRVLVYFIHDPTQNYEANWQNLSGSSVDSSPKCSVVPSQGQSCPAANVYYLPVQFKQNLAQFLSDIKSAGFERLSVALAPEWVNDFYQCSAPEKHVSYSDGLTLTEENWGVIQEVRAITAAAGMSYFIDLGNEYIPPAGYFANGSCQQQIIEGTGTDPGYIRKIWARYTAAYGTADSVGFSAIVGNSYSAQAIYARIVNFLQPAPGAIEIHAYDDPNASGLYAAKSIEASFPASYAVPWIIGETNQNDAGMANGIAAFAANTGKSILYLMQWPAYPNCYLNAPCSPVAYNNYHGAGF